MWRGTGRPFGRSEGNFATVGGDRWGGGDGVGYWGAGLRLGMISTVTQGLLLGKVTIGLMGKGAVMSSLG